MQSGEPVDVRVVVDRVVSSAPASRQGNCGRRDAGRARR